MAGDFALVNLLFAGFQNQLERLGLPRLSRLRWSEKSQRQERQEKALHTSG